MQFDFDPACELRKMVKRRKPKHGSYDALCHLRDPLSRNAARALKNKEGGRVYRCKYCLFWHVAVTLEDKRCVTKHRYTEKEANAEAARAKQFAYRCPDCNGWHLSSRK